MNPSLEAYQQVDTAARRKSVLDYIRANPDQCAEQIVAGMHARSPNVVAPRITELKRDNMIYVSGYTKTSFGRTASTYRCMEVSP